MEYRNPASTEHKIVEGDCCCRGSCTDTNPAQDTQPAVVVSNADCNCLNGTNHNGPVPWSAYYGVDQFWEWYGISECDYIDLEFHSPIFVSVRCDEATGKWDVRVSSYQYNNESIGGSVLTDALTVNANDEFEGTVAVELHDFEDNYECSFTLTFG